MMLSYGRISGRSGPSPGESQSAMKHIGFVVRSRFQVMSLAALPAFELANVVLGAPYYQVTVLSEDGGMVPSSFGLVIASQAFDDTPFDTLVVSGGIEIEPTSPGLRRFLSQSISTTRRIASICTGAFALAEAGLMDGRRATTHWHEIPVFKRMFPKVKIEEDRIFVADGPIWSSAGMSTGIDLALALIENDIGETATKAVAKLLVLYHRRLGGQMQFSALLDMQPKTDRIQNVLAYARQNLAANLSVDRLAEVAALSPRQFSRAFIAEIGRSPAKAIETMRVEEARRMMEDGRLPVETVAAQTGLGDRDRMRQAFIRAYGQTPQAIRRNARAAQSKTPPSRSHDDLLEIRQSGAYADHPRAAALASR